MGKRDAIHCVYPQRFKTWEGLTMIGRRKKGLGNAEDCSGEVKRGESRLRRCKRLLSPRGGGLKEDGLPRQVPCGHPAAQLKRSHLEPLCRSDNFVVKVCFICKEVSTIDPKQRSSADRCHCLRGPKQEKPGVVSQVAH
ncbi:unnamed protein product [Chrysoparadoxa australica]